MSGGRRSRSRLVLTAAFAGGSLIAALVIGPAASFAAPRPIVVTRAPTSTDPPTTPTTTPTTPTTPTPTPTTPTTVLTDPFQPVGPGSAAVAAVSIVDYAFSPTTVTVPAGTTVTWTNTGAAIHSVTSDTGAFDSSPTCPAGPCINPGDSFSHVFTQAGRYSYHCRVHSTMTATVIVTAATPTTTTPTTTATASSTPGGSTVSAAGTPSPTTTNPDAVGAQLAFTGTSTNEAWIALGALLTISVGLALRPRRRPFPVPVPEHRHPRSPH